MTKINAMGLLENPVVGRISKIERTKGPLVGLFNMKIHFDLPTNEVIEVKFDTPGIDLKAMLDEPEAYVQAWIIIKKEVTGDFRVDFLSTSAEYDSMNQELRGCVTRAHYANIKSKMRCRQVRIVGLDKCPMLYVATNISFS